MFKFSTFKAPERLSAHNNTPDTTELTDMPEKQTTDTPATENKIPEKPDESLGSLGKKFLEGTSAHGLPRVLSGSTLRKVIWATIFTFMVGVFLYQCQFLFRRFFSYPVTVSIEVKTNTNITFPSVTICNMNMMKKSFLLNDDRYKSLVALDDETRQNVQYEIESLKSGSGTTSGKRRRKRSLDNINPTQIKQKMLTILKNQDIARQKKKLRETFEQAAMRDRGNLLSKIKILGADGIAGISQSEEWSLSELYEVLRREKRQLPGSGDDYEEDPPEDGPAWDEEDEEDAFLERDEPEDYEEDRGKWDDFGVGGEGGDQGGKDDVFDNFEFHDYGFTDIENDYEFDAFMQQSKTDDYSDLGEVLKPSKQDLDVYGHQAKDLIVQCSWDKTNCSASSFFKTYNPTYGLCYVFNYGKNGETVKTTTKFGSQYGLRLTLNIEYDEYLGLFAHKAGVRVAVHPHDYSPFPEDFGISAAPGMETQIGVERSELSRKPHPHPSNCTKGDDYDLLYDGNYTSLACSMSCIQKRLREKCGCYDKIVVSSSEPRCSLTNATQEQCKQRLYYLYDNNQLGCDCPVPCSELDWDTSSSTADWPSDPYTYLLVANLMSESDNYKSTNVMESVRRNLVRVHVYIASRGATCITEDEAYPWDKLLADLGGLLGLFLGISACTAAEIIEFLFDGSRLCCRRCKKQGDRVGPA